MIAALISSDSGLWYALAVIGVAALAATALLLNAVSSLPDRWVSDVDRQTRARAEAARVLRQEGYR